MVALAGCVTPTGDTSAGDTARLPTDTAADTGETGADTAETGSSVAWEGPELAFQDCAAQTVSLADLAAGTDGLIVGIGAGWCEPCQEDAPLLEAFHAAHPELGLASILVEDADGAPVTRLFCEEWVEAFGLTYPVLVDPLVTTAEYIGESGLPVHVAWAPDGTEVYRASGPFVEAEVLTALGR